MRITHPDRVIDASSGTTKMQLAEYYASVAEWILPQLKDRPVALVRAPDGIAGELFFQKNAGRLAIPGIVTLDKALTGQPVMIINNAKALIGAVQMSTVELHTWNATSVDLDKPDRFVLDLDPDPALPWKSMIEATQLTLTVLDELGLKAFLKTSGGKGIHLVVPLTRKQGWDEVKDFSHAIVSHMAKLLPDRFFCGVRTEKKPCRAYLHRLPAQRSGRHHYLRLRRAHPRRAAGVGADLSGGGCRAQGRQSMERAQRA